MRSLITVTLIAAAFLFIMVGCDILYAQPTIQSYVKFLQPSGWQPAAVVLMPQTPENIRICLEREQGLTSCRSVEEFKIWVTQSSRKY